LCPRAETKALTAAAAGVPLAELVEE
jgi:hypothetical protein